MKFGRLRSYLSSDKDGSAKTALIENPSYEKVKIIQLNALAQKSSRKKYKTLNSNSIIIDIIHDMLHRILN